MSEKGFIVILIEKFKTYFHTFCSNQAKEISDILVSFFPLGLIWMIPYLRFIGQAADIVNL